MCDRPEDLAGYRDESMTTRHVVIHTDVSCLRNPGPELMVDVRALK